MLTHMKLAAPVSATALIVGCAGRAAEQSAGTLEDRAAVTEVRTKYQAAYNAGDAAAIAALFGDDAVSLPDHHGPLQGRGAILKYFQDTFAQYNAAMTIVPGDTDVSGSLAHEHGTYTIKVTPKAGGDTVADDGKYVMILKRGPDGAWKIHHDMDNSNRMPQTGGEGERH